MTDELAVPRRFLTELDELLNMATPPDLWPPAGQWRITRDRLHAELHTLAEPAELPPVIIQPLPDYGPMMLRQNWVDADPADNDGTGFSLDCGAGLGNPMMVLRVEFPDGSFVAEHADVRPMVTAWVERIVAQHTGELSVVLAPKAADDA